MTYWNSYRVHPNGAVEIFDLAAYSYGRGYVTPRTCGTCGRTWDDAVISGVTPVPSARCPFEYEHQAEREALFHQRERDEASGMYDEQEECYDEEEN